MQTLVEFRQNAGLVKHLALIPVFVVVRDPLAQTPRQLPVDHVLLHLLELKRECNVTVLIRVICS